MRALIGVMVSPALVLMAAVGSAATPAVAQERPAAGARSRSDVKALEVVTAPSVVAGQPKGVTSVFTPDVNPIHVWFRLEGARAGQLLRSKWRWLGGGKPYPIGEGQTTVPMLANFGHFEMELAEGKRWPEGAYEVDIFDGDTLLATARFTVKAGPKP